MRSSTVDSYKVTLLQHMPGMRGVMTVNCDCDRAKQNCMVWNERAAQFVNRVICRLPVEIIVNVSVYWRGGATCMLLVEMTVNVTADERRREQPVVHAVRGPAVKLP